MPSRGGGILAECIRYQGRSCFTVTGSGCNHCRKAVYREGRTGGGEGTNRYGGKVQ